MEQVVATISDGNTILVKHVDVWVQISELPGGLSEWYGNFMLPDGIYLDVGGPFQLETTDGRAGLIIVKKVQLDQPSQVDFIGTGPFARVE